MEKSLIKAVSLLIAGFVMSGSSLAQETEKMKLLLRIESAELSITLEDTPAAQAFLELLPLKLELTDYANTEKVADLPAKLPPDGSPSGYQPHIGDFTYYAPWGNLAIFYKAFGYSSGLIKLGHLEGDINLLTPGKPIKISLEKLPE